MCNALDTERIYSSRPAMIVWRCTLRRGAGSALMKNKPNENVEIPHHIYQILGLSMAADREIKKEAAMVTGSNTMNYCGDAHVLSLLHRNKIRRRYNGFLREQKRREEPLC